MPGWFATYGTPLRAGRDFTAADRQGAAPVAIVNETCARRLFGTTDALGRIVRESTPPGMPSRDAEIVGIVADAAYGSLRDTHEPTMYAPLAQLPDGQVFPQASLSVRAAAGEPAALTRSIADALGRVARIDPAQVLRQS
jgi:putative ABC transport system permease protein